MCASSATLVCGEKGEQRAEASKKKWRKHEAREMGMTQNEKTKLRILHGVRAVLYTLQHSLRLRSITFNLFCGCFAL